MQKGTSGGVKNFSSVEEKPMEGGARIRWMITHHDGADNFSMRMIRVPKDSHTPFHSHDYEHEIYVIEGKLDVTIGEKKYSAMRDDFVFIPPEAHHGMVALEDTRIICVVPIRAARHALGD